MTNLGELLAECQMAYVCFLFGFNYDGFDQWKTIVSLFCHSEEAAHTHPDLYIKFIGKDSIMSCPY